MKPTIALSLFYVFCLIPFSIVNAQGECMVCGLYGPSSVPWLDKRLPEDARIPLPTCADVETSSRVAVDGSAICGIVQSFGTYCGCNRPPNACTLCWDGSDVANPNAELPGYDTTIFLPARGVERIFNCEILQAFLHSTPNDSAECYDAQKNATEVCGCPPIPDEFRDERENSTNSTAPPIEDESPPSMTRPCTLCENGEPPKFPEKTFFSEASQVDCSDYEALAATFEEDSHDCRWVRSVGGFCGCSPREDSCSLCPLGEPAPKPSQLLNWFTASFLTTGNDAILADGASNFLSCEFLESALAGEATQLPRLLGTDESLLCLAVQMKSWICGCKPDYRPILLTWSYRTSAFLSFVVSCQAADKRPAKGEIPHIVHSTHPHHPI